MRLAAALSCLCGKSPCVCKAPIWPSLGRYSRFVEALGRRFCLTMVSLYFDDASIADWAQAYGLLLNSTFFLGLLLQKKRGKPGLRRACSSDWIVTLRQHFARAMLLFGRGNASRLSWWPWSRNAVALKLWNQGWQLRSMGWRTSLNRASKAALDAAVCVPSRVVLQFVGSNHCHSPTTWTRRLAQMASQVCCCLWCSIRGIGQGRGRFFLLKPEGDLRLPSSIYQLWTPGDAKLAELELLQVLIALLTAPEHFRSRRGYWYIDNTAALMALICGRSDLTVLILNECRIWFTHCSSLCNVGCISNGFHLRATGLMRFLVKDIVILGTMHMVFPVALPTFQRWSGTFLLPQCYA